jgi:lipid-binding SYLF domain-containing protein
MLKKRQWFAVCAILCLSLVWGLPAQADDKNEADIRVLEAAQVLKDIMKEEGGGIPPWLLKKAKAVAIFPGMLKAGFVVGANLGWGVVTARMPDGGWSAPAFFTMGGGSLGFQIGAQSIDLILVMPTDKGVKGLLENRVKFGTNLAVTAGPVGRQAEASLSDASLTADVYSYSRTKGLFAGVSLEGMGLNFDDQTTKNYYGQLYPVGDILSGKVKAPDNALRLLAALRKYTN